MPTINFMDVRVISKGVVTHYTQNTWMPLWKYCQVVAPKEVDLVPHDGNKIENPVKLAKILRDGVTSGHAKIWCDGYMERIQLVENEKCYVCNEKRYIHLSKTEAEKCPHCNGTGKAMSVEKNHYIDPVIIKQFSDLLERGETKIW